MDFPHGFDEFVTMSFYSLIGYVALTLREDFKEMRDTLKDLSVTVATLVERDIHRDADLDLIRNRLDKLEHGDKN